MNTIQYKKENVKGVNIAYREAGDPSNPTIVLLHGFPSSSHQYRKVLNKPTFLLNVFAECFFSLVTQYCIKLL